MTSKQFREDELFLRDVGKTTGKFEIHTLERQEIDLSNVKLIAYSDTKSKDREVNRLKGVHFFIDDYRFYAIYKDPQKSFEKLSQYAFLLTPDYSLYQEMPYWRQLYSVARSRWVGAWWQRHGLKVIPSVSWSDETSFEFCFEGIPEGSIVAVGMIGCKKNNKAAFMLGYNKMLERIKPSAIICFGKPFPEMEGNIIEVDYMASRKVER